MPLTVLHVFSGDLWAGAERMIVTLLRSLSSYQDLKLIALALNEGSLTKALRDSGIETIVLDEHANSFGGILFGAVRQLRGRNVNLIHSHRHKENFLSFWIGKLLGVKALISTIHGLPEFDGQARGNLRALVSMKLDHFLLKHAFSQIVGVSHDMRRVLVSRYGFPLKRLAVIHNGIDVPVPSSAAERMDCKDAAFHIATIGRMVPVKDLSLFLRVAQCVQSQLKGVRFSILGEGPLMTSLATQVQDLGLSHCVRFESKRENPFPFLETVDLYLNTSRHEGIPLSVLEAMACRKPVVASMVGGLPEIITDGEDGILVKSRSPEVYAKWCIDLAKNSVFRAQLGLRAEMKISSAFSGETMGRSYYSCYRTTM
ncbi:MAG: glycosyltransferase [Nitrospira sp.]